MTKKKFPDFNENIMQLAKQAGFAIDVSNDPNSPPSWHGAAHNDKFELFAELVICDYLKQQLQTLAEVKPNPIWK